MSRTALVIASDEIRANKDLSEFAKRAILEAIDFQLCYIDATWSGGASSTTWPGGASSTTRQDAKEAEKLHKLELEKENLQQQKIELYTREVARLQAEVKRLQRGQFEHDDHYYRPPNA
jgi:hypothetical protein